MEDKENQAGEAAQEFEMSPEEATGFGENANAETPGLFNRKRVMILLSVSFAVVIGGGLLFSALRPGRKAAQAESEIAAAEAPSSFLNSLRDRAVNSRASAPEPERPPAVPEPAAEPEPLLPPAAISRSQDVENVRSYPPPQGQGSSPPPQGSGGGSSAPPPDTSHFRSPLVPPVEGRLFAGSYQPPQGAAQVAPNTAASQSAPRSGGQASEYAQQNSQENKQWFFDSSGSGGAVFSGRFLGENSLWPGTVIPGVLETAINTDLPGNVLARTTRNIYDSQTGRVLLIPQGTVLIARYNSSVSYAQHRVQIVWDTLIRPDGFQLDLDGMNSVDRAGMSGQDAVYHENWFEYLKAAGIIAMFSLANASMTETAAKYADNASASAVAGSSQELMNQLGGSMVSRAMNIQPTLTVENGTPVNVMLNKSLYLPPLGGYPAARKYILE